MLPREDHDAALVAAFDLDGTLARPRSLPGFLLHLAGPRAVAVATIGGLRSAGCPSQRSGAPWWRPDQGGRARFKEGAVGSILQGRPIAEVRAAGREFGASLVRDGLDDAMVGRVELHRQRGARLVLVTAALDVYAEPVGEALGFDHVIATRVEADDRQLCTGRLQHADLHGERKVQLLEQWLAPSAATTRVVAYGNSRDDDALLAFARRTQAPPSHPLP